MASISEMIQLSDYLAQNKRQNSIAGRISSLVDSGVEGYNAGNQYAQNQLKKKSAALDTQVKLMDIKKKQQEMEQEATNSRISNNLAKRMGILDLSPQESDAARSTALDSVTSKTPPKDNTNSGQIKAIQTGDGEFNVVPGSFGKSGLTWDFKKAKTEAENKSEKDPTARNARIREQAEAAARREKYNTIASMVGPDEAQKYANVQPTEDEIQKFLPEMDSYLSGDKKTATTLRDQRRAKDSIVNDSVKELQTQIEDQRARLGVNADGQSNMTLYSATHSGDANQLEKLKARRDSLLQGGGTDALKSQITEDINTLKADPQKNRAQIIALTQKLLKMAQTGRGQ